MLPPSVSLLESLKQRFPTYENKYGFKYPNPSCPTCKGHGSWMTGMHGTYQEIPCYCTLEAKNPIPKATIAVGDIRRRLTAASSKLSISQFLEFYLRYIPTTQQFTERYYHFNSLLPLITPLVNTSIPPAKVYTSIPLLEHHYLYKDLAWRFGVSEAIIYSHYKSIAK